jgi:hypothetical protein
MAAVARLRKASRARSQRAYQRRVQGLRIYRIELDEVALIEKLIEAGRLERENSGEHVEVEKALRAFIEIVCKEE